MFYVRLSIHNNKEIKYSNIPSFPTGSTEQKSKEKNRRWLNIWQKKTLKHSYRIKTYYKNLSGVKNNTVDILQRFKNKNVYSKVFNGALYTAAHDSAKRMFIYTKFRLEWLLIECLFHIFMLQNQFQFSSIFVHI